MRIAEATKVCQEHLQPLYGAHEARIIAGILMEYLTGVRSPKGYNTLSDSQIEWFEKLLERLVRGEPVQYVTGHCWFYGLKFKTDARALIPRPETEELVHWILEKYPADKSIRVLDIGTGTGCIAISLKHKRPNWEVWAIDKSQDAIILCEENAELLHCPVKTIVFDILNQAKWPELGKFDLIVSNPPYIPPSEKEKMSPQVIDYEPGEALFVSESDPLVFYKTIAAFASEFLPKKGEVFFEINEFWAEELVRLLSRWFANLELRNDMQGKRRMLRAEQLG